MEDNILTRQYLESISTADLLVLADDYGIDVPKDLNRRLIIGELLEMAEEQSGDEEEVLVTEDDFSAPDTLPRTYNETQICALLRTPTWAFVFWDIRESLLESLAEKEHFEGLYLHVAFFDGPTEEIPSDSFDIQIKLTDREQFVFIPSGKRYVIINLKSRWHERDSQVLAYTRRIEIPKECDELINLQPGKKLELPPLVKMSGMEELLSEHYKNHRQSLS
ncbi:MAG: DUF4912 domain-containing protein [Treponema sp.]|nr:DUF4912 domain-containing protein [Treponema sp.]